MKVFAIALAGFAVLGAFAQSADWQSGVWHEPQVRYLLADMSLGGNVQLYRDYATKERDPDSREAIRLWDAGARVVNTNDFERRWITNEFGKDGRVMRIVLRGSQRTIAGTEVLLSSDLEIDQCRIRIVLAALSLGASPKEFQDDARPSVEEAIRRWKEDIRVTNTNLFELRAGAPVYAGTRKAIDATHIRLNSDVAYSEMNVRYFLADMFLGGSREFYHRAGEAAHEKACEESVARFDHGVTVTNLRDLERKKVNGKTLITRKGSDERIHGMEIKLSTDQP